MADLKLAIQIAIARKGFETFDRLGGGIRGAIGAVKSMGAELAALAAIGIANFVDASIDKFVDFDTTIRRAAATLGNEGITRFDELSAAAKELGESTAFSATEAASAFEFLGRAGLSVDQSLSAVGDVLNLATVADLELAEAANFATNIMQGFRLEVSDLTSVMDVMAATSTNSNTDITQLAQAASLVAPIAADMGVSLTEAAAAAGVLANNGIFATRTGTSLRRILGRLTDSNREMFQTMINAGVAVDEFKDGNISLEQVLQQINSALESGAISQDEMNKLVGEEAKAAFSILLNETRKAEGGFSDLKRTLESSEGSAQSFVDFMKEGPGFAFAEFEAAVEGLMIQLGEALMPVILGLTDAFKNNQDVLQGVISGVEEFIPILETLVPVIQLVVDSILNVFDVLQGREAFVDLIDILSQLVESVLEVIDALGPLAPLIGFILFPVFSLIFVLSLLKDEIVAGIDIIGEWIEVLIGIVRWFTFFIQKGLEGIAFLLDWIGVLKPILAIFSAIGDAIGFVIDKMKELAGAGSFLGGFFDFLKEGPDALDGEFGSATGGVVRRTQRELVHAGEVIIPAGQVGRFSDDMVGGTSGQISIENFNMTIHTNELDPDEIIRKMNRAFKEFERR